MGSMLSSGAQARAVATDIPNSILALQVRGVHYDADCSESRPIPAHSQGEQDKGRSGIRQEDDAQCL